MVSKNMDIRPAGQATWKPWKVSAVLFQESCRTYETPQIEILREISEKNIVFCDTRNKSKTGFDVSDSTAAANFSLEISFKTFLNLAQSGYVNEPIFMILWNSSVCSV
jgi:hypothetical protein